MLQTKINSEKYNCYKGFFLKINHTRENLWEPSVLENSDGVFEIKRDNVSYNNDLFLNIYNAIQKKNLVEFFGGAKRNKGFVIFHGSKINIFFIRKLGVWGRNFTKAENSSPLQ